MRIALMLMLACASADGADKPVEVAKCGGAVVTLAFERPDPRVDQVETVLSVTRGAKRARMRFSAIDFIGAECRTSLVGKPYVVFQAYCGGSSCRDLDNYGIIDPATLVIVMEPNDWNRDDAARFMGTGVEPVHDLYSVDTRKPIHAR